MTSPVDIRPDHLEIVQDILREHLPGDVKVWVFGSRANWTTKDSSDLDLALEGDNALNHELLSVLKDAFKDSALPYTVDVVDIKRIGDSFRQIVKSQRTPLPMDGDGTTTNESRKVTLGEAVDITLSSVDKKSKPNEHEVRLCNYTDVYKNSFIHSKLPFMAATATAREIAKCSLFSGDVIITKDSEKDDDIGVPALVREYIADLVCGYHLAILRCSQELDGTYLFYALCTREAQQQFHAYANGITRFGLRKADIARVEIPLPPLSEQRTIAHVLGTLDDKIELNRRMNETLEAMARALFKDWFVDFGPVRAKMAGREPYLPPDVWSLFPDRLVPSELGDIPEGWQVGTVGDLAEQRRDSENPQSSPDALFRHYSIPAFDEGKVPALEYGREIKSAKSRVRPDVVLLSKLNPEVERVWLPDVDSTEAAVCSTEFMVLRPKPPFQRSYVYGLARSSAFREQIQTLVTGTSKSHQRAPAKAVLALGTVLPPRQVLDAFCQEATALLERVLSHSRETVSLSAQRDALLPALVSGTMRVVGAGSRDASE